MKKFLVAAITACVCSAPLYAEKADSEKPTNIEADTMTIDDIAQITTFSGNVVITKGTILIKSEFAEVHQDPEGYQFTKLTAAPGQLASFKQKQDGGPDLWVEAYGEVIEYNDKYEQATCRSRARFKRIENKKVIEDVTGEYVSYNSRTEFYSVHNTKDGVSKPGAGRVRLVLTPRDKPAKNAKKTAAPKAAAPQKKKKAKKK